MSGRGRPVIAVPRPRSTTTTSSAAQYHYNLRGQLLHATFPTRAWTYSETTVERSACARGRGTMSPHSSTGSFTRTATERFSLTEVLEEWAAG